MRKVVGGEIKRQRGGHPELLTFQETRSCVILVTEGRFGIAFATTKQLRSKTNKLSSNIIVMHVMRKSIMDAQVQQR
jgi:hypothetical protein